MKKLKKVLLVIVAFLILIALSLLIYLQTTKPQYEGEVDIKNISVKTPTVLL
jgi:penicillin amidase